jgi:hypothetical protein
MVRSLALELSLARAYMGKLQPCIKYFTRVEITESDQHYSLVQQIINYNCNHYKSTVLMFQNLLGCIGLFGRIS